MTGTVRVARSTTAPTATRRPVCSSTVNSRSKPATVKAAPGERSTLGASAS